MSSSFKIILGIIFAIIIIRLLNTKRDPKPSHDPKKTDPPKPSHNSKRSDPSHSEVNDSTHYDSHSESSESSDSFIPIPPIP